MEAAELHATVRLLAGLLVPCVALLCCLNGLLLLRRRSPARPPLPRHGHSRRPRQPPTPPWTFVSGGSAGPPRPPPCLYGRRGQARAGTAPGPAVASATSSSASDLDRRPLLVPPNSPASSWGARGIPDRAFSRQQPSAQRKVPSCRPAFPARSHPSPFEYGSSIRRGDGCAQLGSANLTASQGPGLDSDFGASAGVSLQILSSDSEESPTAPLLHPQQSGRFEWDYYDPSYKKSPPLQRHLPCICSKQYWL